MEPGWIDDRLFALRRGSRKPLDFGYGPATAAKRDERALTTDDIGYDLEPQFSNNGKSIVFHRSLYVDNIYKIQTDGTGAGSGHDQWKRFFAVVERRCFSRGVLVRA